MPCRAAFDDRQGTRRVTSTAEQVLADLRGRALNPGAG
jgi:hypothetical protein